MFTPDNHSRLATLSTQPTLTPDDAKFITFLIRGNSYLYDGQCKWCYPVDDHGYPVPGFKWIIQPIKRMSHGGCTPNPSSLSSTTPWLEDGVSRSYWYARNSQHKRTQALLALLPASQRAEEKVGLKLYTVLAQYARVHKLDINRLWGAVCEMMSKL